MRWPVVPLALLAACAAPAPPEAVALPPSAAPGAPAAPPRRIDRPVLVPQSIHNVIALAWSPDGHALAAAGDDGVLLCDADEGVVRAVLSGAHGEPRWTADGAAIVVHEGRHVGRSRITSWDAATGARRAAIDLSRRSLVTVTPALVAAAQDGAVEVLDTLTGARRASFAVASPRVLALGAGGRRLAVASEDGSVQVCDVAAGTSRPVLQAGAAKVRDLGLSPDERTLAVASEGAQSARLTLRDLESGRERGVDLPWSSGWEITWGPDGRTLVAGSGSVLVRADTLAFSAIDGSHGARYSPSGKRLGLLSVTYNHQNAIPGLVVRTVETGEEAGVGLGDRIGISEFDAAFRPGDEAIAYAVGWEIGLPGPPGGPPLSLEATPDFTRNVVWEGGGATLAFQVGPVLHRWTSATGAFTGEALPGEDPMEDGERFATAEAPPGPPQPTVVSRERGREISWLPDGSGKKVMIVDEPSQKTIATIRGIDEVLGPSPGGDRLATRRGDRLVLWSTANGKQGMTFPVGRRRHFGRSSFHWSEDGDRLLIPGEVPLGKSSWTVAGFDLWDSRSGKKLHASADGKSPLFGSYAPLPPAFAFATPDRVVVLDARTGAERAVLPRASCQKAVAMGDRVLALCGGKGQQRGALWDVTTKAEIPLPEWPPVVGSMELLAGGALAVAVGWKEDGAGPPLGLWAWDAHTGALAETLPLQGATAFAVRPDGRFVAVAERGGVLLVRLADHRRLHLTASGPAPLAYTDDLLFDGDDGAAATRRLRLGGDLLHAPTLRLTQLADRFRRPGLVADFMAGKPLALPEDVKDGVGAPPRVTLTAGPAEQDQPRLRIVDRGGGIGAVRVILDGRPVAVAAPTAAELAAGLVERSLEPPAPGSELGAEASTAAGSVWSAPARIAKKKP